MSRKRTPSYRPVVEGLEDRVVPSALAGIPWANVLAEPTSVALNHSWAAQPASGSGQPAGLSPSQLRHAYAFDQILFNSGTIQGDGSGQTIALIDAYDQPNIASDLATFDATYGLPAPPSFTKVNQTGGTSYPAADQGWGLEISLDVEWAHAIAPGANLLLVEANSSGMGDLLTAVDYARHLAGVSVVSMSWGSSEYSFETAWDGYFTTPAGHAGVTFVASSGDRGSSGAPEYPSISPGVLAVGGTALTLDSPGNYVSETGWSGSGGGLSLYESQPGYQKGVVTQSSTLRGVPDVAYDASSTSAVAVYDTSSSSGWLQVAGTSAGAPQWAALVAIADQGLALASKGPLDGASQTLSQLYQLPGSDFHDVTSGSNGAYSAAVGYDLVTGLGTPIANLVVAGLSGNSSNQPPVVVTPASGTPNPVTGTTTSLSVLGNDDGGEANLTYTWSVVSGPSGAAMPTFSGNGTNAAKNSTATFYQAGTYTFQVTLTDKGGLTATSSVTVIVNQTLTHITLTPGTATVFDKACQQFSTTATDQFGNVMSTPPGWTWTLGSGSVGTLNANGLYTAPAAGSGTATVQVSAGPMTSSAAVSTMPPGPSIVTPAQATPSPVTGTTTGLSVSATDPTGTSGLTYTWSVTSAPSGAAAPTYSLNGTNAAQNTTATFFQAGTYTFQVTVADPAGLTATSSVTVIVNQTFTNISVSPGSVALAVHGQQQFQASGLDQFGQKLASQPTNYTWSIAGGGIGSINSNGQYTAPNSGTGSATVQATSGAVTGMALITVKAFPPVITQAASSKQNPVTGTQTQLQVQASDPQGANLTYAWSVTSQPAGATTPTFSNPNNNQTNVTFYLVGSYTVTVTVQDALGLSATSSVTVAVVQTCTCLSVTPGNVTLANGATQQFTAGALDQFGKAMASPPNFTWQVNGGGGTISSTGLYTAPTSGTGNFQVKVSANGLNAQANITVTTIPAAPSNLTGNASLLNGSAQVQLQWNSNSNNQTGFIVQRSSDGGLTWTTIVVLTGNPNKYTDTTVSRGTTYTYRVCAYNVLGDSLFSNLFTITTP